MPRAQGWEALAWTLGRDPSKELPAAPGERDGHSALSLPRELVVRHLGGTRAQAALPSSSSSSSLAARGEMVGMPNHLGRCDQIALLKGAKPV